MAWDGMGLEARSTAQMRSETDLLLPNLGRGGVGVVERHRLEVRVGIFTSQISNFQFGSWVQISVHGSKFQNALKFNLKC